MSFCPLIPKSVFFLPSIDFNLKFLNFTSPLWGDEPIPIDIPTLFSPYISTLKNDFSKLPFTVSSNFLLLDKRGRLIPLESFPSITIGLFN